MLEDVLKPVFYVPLFLVQIGDLDIMFKRTEPLRERVGMVPPAKDYDAFTRSCA